MYWLPELKILEFLKVAGIRAEKDETIKEIAGNSNSNPMAVFEILKDAAEKVQ